MKTYSVEETSKMIGKTDQTVRAYVKRGFLSLSQDNASGFRITEESIKKLNSKLSDAMQNLRSKRSSNMKNKWKIIKSAS